MNVKDPLADAAARALIAERCQRAYLHDIRGGLQALSGALELLGRLAKSGDGADAAMADRAVTIAKRALANHENAMLDLVRQLTASPEAEERVDLGVLVGNLLQFLRNDFATRQVATRIELSPEICVQAARNQLRFVLLGLLTRRIDALPLGGELAIRLERRDGQAILTLRSSSGGVADGDPVLEMARDWALARGGRLESNADALELHWPGADIG